MSKSYQSSPCNKLRKKIQHHGGLYLINGLYCISNLFVKHRILEKANEYHTRTTNRIPIAKFNNDYIKPKSQMIWYRSWDLYNHNSSETNAKKNTGLYRPSYMVKKSNHTRQLVTTCTRKHRASQFVGQRILTEDLFLMYPIMEQLLYWSLKPSPNLNTRITSLHNYLSQEIFVIFIEGTVECFNYGYVYIYSLWTIQCKFQLRDSIIHLTPGTAASRKGLATDPKTKDVYLPTDLYYTPPEVSLVLWLLGLCVAGFWHDFSPWDGWIAMEEIYCMWSTVIPSVYDLKSTPSKSYLEIANMNVKTINIQTAINYLLSGGMALLSMCINLMQEQLVEKCRWFAKQVGITEEEIDPNIKYKIKKSKKGSVPETPADRDGNKHLKIQAVHDGESTTINPNTGRPYSPITSRPHSTGRPHSSRSGDLKLSDLNEE
ncbi:unnamed protein product [Meganyctiphanes norvegica]|uniref:Odorant receptor n=1 Tax=Meganyctiphanes norvegica TaxID=48144 RepID=A0AAV2PVZ1_MEGNR